jgi:RimJ/RimL family protein N-acetyltransferase
MSELVTPRLRLRRFCEGDVNTYFTMCRDPEMMRFVGQGQPLTRAQTWMQVASFMGHWQIRGYGTWAVEEADTGALIGRIGFQNPAGWPGVELTWFLDKPLWGRGFATEAARAALKHGFNDYGFDKVVGLVHPDNFPSARVAVRLGGERTDTITIDALRMQVYTIDKAHAVLD